MTCGLLLCVLDTPTATVQPNPVARRALNLGRREHRDNVYCSFSGCFEVEGEGGRARQFYESIMPSRRAQWFHEDIG
eukprot:gene14532-biopygen16845